MRFTPLILAAATATLFNVYAYAKPVMELNLNSAGHLQDPPYCDNVLCDEICVDGGWDGGYCLG